MDPKDILSFLLGGSLLSQASARDLATLAPAAAAIGPSLASYLGGSIGLSETAADWLGKGAGLGLTYGMHQMGADNEMMPLALMAGQMFQQPFMRNIYPDADQYDLYRPIKQDEWILDDANTGMQKLLKKATRFDSEKVRDIEPVIEALGKAKTPFDIFGTGPGKVGSYVDLSFPSLTPGGTPESAKDHVMRFSKGAGGTLNIKNRLGSKDNYSIEDLTSAQNKEMRRLMGEVGLAKKPPKKQFDPSGVKFFTE